jgi:hypothetical protein
VIATPPRTILMRIILDIVLGGRGVFSLASGLSAGLRLYQLGLNLVQMSSGI